MKLRIYIVDLIFLLASAELFAEKTQKKEALDPEVAELEAINVKINLVDDANSNVDKDFDKEFKTLSKKIIKNAKAQGIQEDFEIELEKEQAKELVEQKKLKKESKKNKFADDRKSKKAYLTREAKFKKYSKELSYEIKSLPEFDEEVIQID